MRRPPLLWLLLPFALGYGGSYFYRNVGAVAGPILAQEFAMGPGDLGFLTSAYFLSFALAQIPLGFALDRFGPALVNAVMLTTAALGATIFGCADSTEMLILGRGLIGLGAGAALMSAMSAVHIWAGHRRAATCIGLIMAVGGIGAIFAGTPSQYLIDEFGWRALFFALATFSCLVACLTLTTLGHVRPAAGGQTMRELLAGAAQIYRSPIFWRICIPFMLTLGTMLAFQSLWAATWMRDVAGYTDKIAIANVLVAFNIGMTAAFLCAGAIADALKARGITHLATMKCFFVIALMAQAWLLLAPTRLPHLAWATMSFGANALVLGFPLLAARFPPQLTGRVNTSINMLAFSCAFLLQWGIGLVVNLWPAHAGGYAVAGSYVAWGAMLLAQAIAFVWLLTSTRAGPAAASQGGQ